MGHLNLYHTACSFGSDNFELYKLFDLYVDTWDLSLNCRKFEYKYKTTLWVWKLVLFTDNGRWSKFIIKMETKKNIVIIMCFVMIGADFMAGFYAMKQIR